MPLESLRDHLIFLSEPLSIWFVRPWSWKLSPCCIVVLVRYIPLWCCSELSSKYCGLFKQFLYICTQICTFLWWLYIFMFLKEPFCLLVQFKFIGKYIFMNVLKHVIDYMNTQLVNPKLLKISLPPIIVHFIYNNYFAEITLNIFPFQITIIRIARG